jgi:spore germination protein GerM
MKSPGGARAPGSSAPWCALGICLLFTLSCSGAQEQAESQTPVESIPVEPAEEGSPGASGDTTTSIRTLVVEVYFPSAEEDGLVAEAREIFATAAPGDRAKQIVADLISGPATDLAVRALPRDTKLRQIYVLDDGVAYIDFSAELRDGLGGGSSGELLAVYSIVDSVALNVSEIRRVGILINSKPVETLNGHVDLRRPLRPDISLIVGRVADRETEPDWEALARAETTDNGSSVR